MHACLAVSGKGERWFLLNATPDVHHQIASDSRLHPGPGARETPVAGVLLTDAEFDHTIGLLLLREGSSLDVYGTEPVLESLAEHFPVSRLLTDYADLSWRRVRVDKPIDLDDRLRVTPFATGKKAPRYVANASPDRVWEVAYRLEDRVTGGTAVYAPAVPQWDPEIDAQSSTADCVFIDGTFWTDDEMLHAGTGDRVGRSMGHMPISGEGGSAEVLAQLKARTIYTHINNTNPILDETSAERAELAARGIEVGWAGLQVEL
ncbi:pyrroloquinoline quinone biosynthesis protein PqqB [Parasphingorhabdus pacifica]